MGYFSCNQIREMKHVFLVLLLCCGVYAQAQNQKAQRVDPNEQKEKVNQLKQGPIEFTLRNNSLKSIPLWIPGVMNPNLSPMSSSGVGLKVGQKVYFKHRGKKELLLEVKGDYDTRVLDVAKLIRDRGLQIDKEKAEGRKPEKEREPEMVEEKRKSKKKKKRK